MKLGEHDIHVWLAFDADFIGSAWLDERSGDLQPHEHAIAARRLENLRPQYRMTRALQRAVLSLYAPQVAPGQWRFRTDEAAGAKPELAPEFAGLGLHFNLSHTSGLVAMAVGRRPTMGLDAECLAVARAPLDIADRFFTTAELADLAALPAAEHARRFYSLWTLKEAWLKATGEGITADLFGLSFEFDDATRARAFQMSRDDPTQWSFWQGSPGGDHRLSLALRGRADVSVFRCRADRVLEWRSLPALQRVGSDQEERSQP